MRKLPPNPFERDAVSRADRLAGRGDELRTLDYYLSLSARGHGHHLAIVGDRGVGKTSLLNAADQICSQKSLVPVRLNLDEGKTAFPGRFWFTLYNAVLLKVFSEGAWGGRQGPIFTTQFRALFSKVDTGVEHAVLLVPVQYAAHTGDQDSFVIDPSLLVEDLRSMVAQLGSHAKRGIVLLIDEADCLKTNPTILQELRNVCQSVQGLSLTLAGTNQVFPVISDIFSPMPRQFFKIDVKRFSHWSATYELISDALEGEEDLMPTLETVQELHQLAAGDPSELKLYCHHMYKTLEEGEVEGFQLSPVAIRRVLNEFKVGASGSAKEDIERIDGLDPDTLTAPWLQFRNLTAQQVSYAFMFGREVVGGTLSEEGVLEFSDRIQSTFANLRSLGLSQEEDKLVLAGDPLSSAYWKSLARSKSSRTFDWIWTPYESLIPLNLFMAFARQFKVLHTQTRAQDDFQDRAIVVLRKDGKPSPSLASDVENVMEIAIAGRGEGVDLATDIIVKTTHENAIRWHRLTQVRPGVLETITDEFRAALDKVQTTLDKFDLNVEIVRSTQWPFPSDEEMHRLGRAARIAVPEEIFGPGPITRAVECYRKGDLPGAVALFERVIADRDDPGTRNNLGFIALLSGDMGTAEKHFEAALAEKREPLYLHNYALLLATSGDVGAARNMLEDALGSMDAGMSALDLDDMVAMLVLNPGLAEVKSAAGLPMDAACVLNLAALGARDAGWATAELNRRYPGRAFLPDSLDK